jgi:hypothetical protein
MISVIEKLSHQEINFLSGRAAAGGRRPSRGQ